VNESVALAKQGLTLEQIAEKRGRKTTTIANHLVEWLEDGNALDIDKLLSPQKIELMKQQFAHHKTEFLKPVIEALDGQVNYDEAKIVRAFLRKS